MTLFRHHGRHAAPRSSRRAERRGADWRDGYEQDDRDADTVAVFESINRPARVARQAVRQIVLNTYWCTRSVGSAQIMAGYLRTLAGAR